MNEAETARLENTLCTCLIQAALGIVINQKFLRDQFTNLYAAPLALMKCCRR